MQGKYQENFLKVRCLKLVEERKLCVDPLYRSADFVTKLKQRTRKSTMEKMPASMWRREPIFLLTSIK